ncbi:hypothetical protein [Thetidibacter halocola]|uniref:Transporter n=1 Tax=Thetidibacter halocola TaxID=2827239 RepID=A0A8J8B786_9RHOB|nr:hypothetical protein [Thetidibacter halocola]MBS0124846.1 hypothetical protein [Thetidibacter halocola]
MSRALAFLLCLLLPGAAMAGAWQRETGSVFVATTVRLGWPQDIMTWTSMEPTSQYNTVYLEYGLSPRLTLGLDLGRAVSGASKAVGFVQIPLRQAERGPQMALQLGAGQIENEPVLRPGLSVGWSLERGWLGIDSLAEIGVSNSRVDLKSDITWGRSLQKGRLLILQVQTGLPANEDAFVRFAPSLVTPLTKRLKLETGVGIGLVGDRDMGVTMGLWAEF